MGVNTHTDFESRPRYGCGYDEKQRERQGRPCKGVMGKVMAPANVGEGKETVYRFDLGLRSVERKRGENEDEDGEGDSRCGRVQPRGV